MEMEPNEGKDEIVLSISHLSLEEKQDPPAPAPPVPKQTSVPRAKATKPEPGRPTRGRLANPRHTENLFLSWEGGNY